MPDEPTPKKEGDQPANEEASKPKTEEKPSGVNWKDLLAPFVAVLLLVFYVVFLLSLRQQIEAEELQWTRWIYLLSGVEAIAFAAAGYLFGKEVHRQQAENASQQAQDAQQEANDANQRATDAEKDAVEAKTKGQALAVAVQAKASGQTGKRSTYGHLGKGDAAASLSQSDFDELATLAKKLFP